MLAVAGCDGSSSRTVLPGSPPGSRASDATPSDGATGSDANQTGDGAAIGDAGHNQNLDAGSTAFDSGSMMGLDAGRTGDASSASDAGQAPGGDASTGIADSGLLHLDAGPPADGGPLSATCDPDLENNAIGGSPVGLWAYNEGCVSSSALSALSMVCPTATLSNQSQATSGILEVTNVGTFSRNVTDSATADAHVPAICAGIAGGCPGVESSISIVVPGAVSRCMDDGTGGCDCNLTVAITINDSGTYVVNGNVVTVSPTGAMQDLYYYFSASGNVLKYQGLDTNPYDNRTSYVLTK